MNSCKLSNSSFKIGEAKEEQLDALKDAIITFVVSRSRDPGVLELANDICDSVGRDFADCPAPDLGQDMGIIARALVFSFADRLQEDLLMNLSSRRFQIFAMLNCEQAMKEITSVRKFITIGSV